MFYDDFYSDLPFDYSDLKLFEKLLSIVLQHLILDERHKKRIDPVIPLHKLCRETKQGKEKA